MKQKNTPLAVVLVVAACLTMFGFGRSQDIGGNFNYGYALGILGLVVLIVAFVIMWKRDNG